MIFKHLVPASTFGLSPALSSVQQSFVVQDAERAIYAQVSAAPTPAVKVGFIPATSDGFGGITQLARDLNIRNNPQTTPPSAFTASLVGSTLTVYWPSMNLMWDGVLRGINQGNTSSSVSTGTYSLVVSYSWGLTQFAILSSSSVESNASYTELCQINVNTTSATATIVGGRVNTKFVQGLAVRGITSTSYSIPVSDGSGNLTW